MKKKNLAVFNSNVFIYKKAERDKFVKDYGVTLGKDDAGMNCGNGIWIGESTVWVCAHESSHYVDWLIEEHLRTNTNALIDNTEIRAYLVGYVTQAVWDYVSA